MNSGGAIAGGTTVVLAVLCTAALISRVSAFYKHELADGIGRRELTLDGLRGVAALMVATHHAGIFRNWLASGGWGEAGSPILQAIGPGGVHLFFMLTGYLFWSKARAAGGKLRMMSLWRGRLFRIAPLYLFSVALIVVTALALKGTRLFTGASWNTSARVLALGFLPWRAFGDFDIGNINAGVVWTLWYEWRFYFILPFIAWLASGRRVFWLSLCAYAGVFCGLFLIGLNMQPGLVFVLGMLCPVLLDDQRLRAQLQTPAAAGVALAVTILFAALNKAPLLSFPFAATLFPVFLLAAAGNSFWGFLVHPATRCLGAISYSLYLLHGIIFYVVSSILKTFGLTALPGVCVWIILTAAIVGTTFFCAATYRWIESPFLSRSHKRTGIRPGSEELQAILTSAPQ